MPANQYEMEATLQLNDLIHFAVLAGLNLSVPTAVSD
jgi:hypothetical protein